MAVDRPREQVTGRDAGPVARLYSLTGGRTRATGVRLDLVTLLVATWNPVEPVMRLAREHHRLRSLCREPATVAFMASEVDLPVTIVKVLLGDLFNLRLVQEVPQQIQEPARYDLAILEDVLNDLGDL
ncbi:DUF742 domain-containing protein [Actinocorallia longicatena]|uniref:DUF742 domain-containing protein n=1 Tax=Actinocorallia longicatena TaxID=111803 RepID=A0ABP6QJR9_9ACTN